MYILLFLTLCSPLYVSAVTVSLTQTDVKYVTPTYDDVRAKYIAIDQPRKYVYTTGGEYINVFKLGSNDTLKELKTQQFPGMTLGQVRHCANFITIIMTNSTDPSMVSLDVFKVYNRKTGADMVAVNTVPLPGGAGSHQMSSDCRTVVVPITAAVETGDGDGMVTIIKFRRSNLAFPFSTTDLGFENFEGEKSRLESEGALFDDAVAFTEGLEPVYLCMSADETAAYVVLQPNNIIATVNVTTETILSMKGLGFVDWNTGDGFDTNSKDGINLANYPILGARTPSQVQCFVSGGVQYVITVGDGLAPDRQQIKVKDMTLDPTAFPDTSFQSTSQAGLLNVWQGGDDDGDGDYDRIISLGSRGVALFAADTMTLVADTGSMFENMFGNLQPDFFNSDSKFPDKTLAESFDRRSTNRGPEPRSSAVFSTCKDRYIVVMVGMEMPGGVIAMTLNTVNLAAGFEFQALELPIKNYLTNETWNDVWSRGDASLLRVEDLTLYEARSPVLLSASAYGSSTDAFRVRVKCSG